MARVFNFGTDNRFSDLIKGINKAKLGNETKKYFIDYLNDVKQGTRNNDFYEDDFLECVIKEVITNGDKLQNRYSTYNDAFESLIARARVVFPEGTNTDDYELLRNTFINSISADIDLFNSKLYAIFVNKRDYIDLINIIAGDKLLIKNLNIISEYGIEISTYGLSQEELKNELIAFINNISRTDNVKNLFNNRIKELNKRHGVYDVDEKKIALSVETFEQASAIFKQIDTYLELVKKAGENSKLITDGNKKELSAHQERLLREIKSELEATKNSYMELLKNLYENSEKDLRPKMDKMIVALFDEHSKEYFDKALEIKKEMENVSTSAIDKLLEIQNAIEKGKKEIDAYSENGPKLREMLKKIQDDADFTKILSLLKMNKDTILNVTQVSQAQPAVQQVQAPEAQTPTQVLDIPEGKTIVQSPGIILPMNYYKAYDESKIDFTILPTLDENIPFKKRLEMVTENMEAAKKEGQLFHKDTIKIAVCLMEGEWVYVWGETGCGKSFALEQAANLVGLKVSDLSKITDKFSVTAYDDPHGRFRENPVSDTVAHGGLLLLEEFDNGNQDTAVIFNRISSQLFEVVFKPGSKKYVTFADNRVVRVHPNFRLGSTGNTPGLGPNEDYSSRKKFDESVSNRGTLFEMTYDEELEKSIFAEKVAWCELFHNFRAACKGFSDQENKENTQGIITTRDAQFLVRFIDHNSKTLEDVILQKFTQVKGEKYLDFIIQRLTEIYSKKKGNLPAIDLSSRSDISRNVSLNEYTREELAKKLIYVADREMRRRKS